MTKKVKYKTVIDDVQVYKSDGRTSITVLYRQYERLVTDFGWKKETIYSIKIKTKYGDMEIPALAFFSPEKGEALWINAGIHGEEPAGPIALARNVKTLGELGRKTPMAVFPLLNPDGYSKGWRYFNEYRDWHKGTSVSDSGHHLPHFNNPSQPRVSLPSSDVAAQVTKFALEHMDNYPPLLTIDHHEDEKLPQSYVYSQGSKGAEDPIARYVVTMMSKIIPMLAGETRFGEKVVDGVVSNRFGKPIKDASIDEFYATPHVFINGRWVNKAAAKTALTIETPAIGVPLATRVIVHTVIIREYKHLWELIQE